MEVLPVTHKTVSLWLGYLLIFFFFFFLPTTFRVVPPGFRLWQPVTGAFAEAGVVPLLVSLFCLFTFGTLLEPLWGAAEWARFVLLVTALAGLASAFAYVVGWVGVYC